VSGAVFTVNAGSSSLKYALVDADAGTRLTEGAVERIGGAYAEAFRTAFAAMRDHPAPVAFAHRVVHGGTRFTAPVVIDDDVLGAVRELAALAPLHNPANADGIAAARAAHPDVPHVAVFDTAFHATLPAAAATYAIPRDWRERWPLRRYGFHGLSHAYASRRTAELLSRPLAELRTVTCHLGAGASLAAVSGGVSLDTTMGFTPLEGLAMATRSGSVDPGLVLWVQTEGGMSAAEVTDGLEHDSGLVGIAGTADMRGVLRRAAAGDPDATLALDLYIHRVRAGIAAMAASMGGLDAVAFTGGVGEHAPEIRRRAVDGLGFLGLAVDPARNGAADGDAVIGIEGGSVAIVVVTAREDIEIARQVRVALEGRS
jgi:acetate kinase